MTLLLLALLSAPPTWVVELIDQSTTRPTTYRLDASTAPGTLPAFELPQLGAKCRFVASETRDRAVLSCPGAWVVSLVYPERASLVMTVGGYEVKVRAR